MKFLFLFLIGLPLISKSQVNLQSGAAQINIPIYTYSNKDGLNTNISLDYIDGNGLKVGEVASCIGTGWNLQYGGVITREQRGLPDDQSRSLILQNPLPPPSNYMTYTQYYTSYFPNGYLFSYYSPIDNITNEGGYVKMLNRHYSYLTYPQGTVSIEDGEIVSSTFGKYPETESVVADREQDIFHLNYGNGIIDFVIGKGGQIKVLSDSRIKIQLFFSDMLGQNIKTRIEKFIVTDEQGIQYIYSDKELSQTCTFNIKRFTGFTNTISLDENNIASPGGYYSQGNTPIIGSFPIFIGKKTPMFIVNKWYLSKIINPRTNKEITFNYTQYDIDIPGQRLLSAVAKSGNDPNVSMTINRDVIKALRINNIVCSPTTSVQFIYDIAPRIDMANEKALKEIQILENNNLIKKYVLDYGYFFTSVIRPYNYQFTADEKFATRLCLKSVQQTGYDNTTSEPPYLFDYYTGNSQNVGVQYIDIVPSMNCYWSDHWGYYNSQGLNFYQYKPTEIPGITVLSNICVNAVTVKSPVAGLAQNGIIKQITYPLGGTLLYEYEQNDAFFNNQNVTAGGVRVKTITQYDGTNHTNDIIKDFKYTKEDGISSSGWGYESSTYSINKSSRTYSQSGGKSGVNFGDIAISLIRSALVPQNTFATILQILVALFTPSEPEWRDETYTDYSNVSFESANPLPYQYSRVEIIEKKLNGNNNGKTVYEFTSDQYYPILIPTFSFPFSNQQRFVKWAYGLPKRIAVYNNLNKIQRETINDYNTIASPFVDDNFMSKKWEANKYTIDGFPSTHSDYLNQSGNVTQSSIYYPLTGHTELTSTKERVYNKDATAFVEQITTYTYNSSNFQPKTITTTNSVGDVVQQKIYYPEDYTYGSFITDMKNANILSTPISTESWITKSGGQPQMLSTSVIEFGTAPNGDIKPVRGNTLNSSVPLSEGQIGVFNPSVLIRNTNFIKQQNEISYDNKGSAIQTIDLSGNRVNSTIYDYDDRYVVAQINNAYQKDLAYSSFETESTGGWTKNAGYIMQDQGGITGKKMFSGNVSKTFTQGGNYTVTLWTKVSLGATVNGSSGALLNSINDWRLYKWDLSSVSTVSVSGAFDELRLYPQTARMVTTIYDPLIGKTSECDANNHIVYYEYDGLSRLILVRDQNKNILKKYCYNYAGQQENCTVSTTPQWQLTGNLRCVIDGNGNHTGYQEREEIDNNTYSATNNQLRWADNGYNPIACPLPIVCTSSSCAGEGFQCVYGHCEQGYRINTGSYYDDSLGRWVCIYHYEFSDGSWSQNYYQYSFQQCPYLN